jgi:hypothetical protein
MSSPPRTATARFAVVAVAFAVLLVVPGAVSAGVVSSENLLAPAATLPTLPVTVPVVSAPVKAPAVPVKTPTVTVTAPTVTVKPPAVAVKPPTVAVKAPAVSVKTPMVTVKAPALPVKAPSVPAKSPAVPVKAAVAPLKAPANPAKVLTQPAKAPVLPLSTPSVSGVISKITAALSAATPRSGAPAAGATGNAPATTDSPGSVTNASEGLSAADLVAGPLGPSYGQSPNVASTSPASSSPGAGRSALARIARNRSMTATVARLQGCLSVLPPRSRLALRLRTGLGMPSALEPSAAAARLHLGVARFERLERRAMRELRATARTHSCARASTAVAGLLVFIAEFDKGAAGPRGGVEAVRYEAEPSPPRAVLPAPPSSRDAALGADISPLESGVILALLLLLGGSLVVGLVVADNAGLGPRHAAWRRRIINRVPWLR